LRGQPLEAGRHALRLRAGLLFPKPLSTRYLLLWGVLLAAYAMAAAPVSVRVQRDGGVVRLQATVFLDAAPEAVWAVLTDYGGQASFVPGLTESRVISRDSEGSTVVQKGRVKALFLRFGYDIEYTTREVPPRLLTSTVTRGSVKRMHSEYRLSPETGGTRLDYVGEVEPEGWLVPLIGPWVVRTQVEKQLEAVAREIERRRRGEGQP
jgi:carbon monoxide dehydrogenase subunit G